MARLCCSLLLLLPGPAVAQKEADPTSAAAAAAGKPHIVFCLTDDLGWNTMYNNPDIVSPHVNALAAGGVTLTSHYVYRYCSPTRAAFLVGRSPFHLLNIRENLLPAQIPQATDPRFTMLPKRLHDAGYYSYQVGKWHQGSAYRKWTPVGRGFDKSYGFLGGGEDHFTQQTGTCTYTASNKETVRGSVTDYWEETAGSPGRHITDCDIPAETAPACPIYTVLNLNGSKADNIKRCAAGHFVNCAVPKGLRGGSSLGGNLTDAEVERHPEEYQCYQCKPSLYTGYDFNDQAVKMIGAHTSEHPTQPLFMYLALHNTHAPIEAPPEWEALYSKRLSFPKQITFDAMVSVVDSTVGNVTAALKQAGLWENTLFIWTTDNGSPVQVAGSNAPLRGGKGSDWEGGTRTPALITGGALPARMAGKTLSGIVAVWDWFATFAALAGVDPTEPQPASPTPVDSINMWGYFSGEVADSPRKELVYDHLMFTGEHSACTYNGLVQVGPCDGAGAIRVGDLKLMVGTFGYAGLYGHFTPNASWTANMTHLSQCSVGWPCLFNVSTPNDESHNLAAEMPAAVASMKARFLSYNASYHPPSVAPAPELEAYCQAVLLNGGYSSPWRSG